jgi:hypothetical protein
MVLFLHAARHLSPFEVSGHRNNCAGNTLETASAEVTTAGARTGLAKKNNDDPFEEQHRAKSI